jgi:hypothetical protein
MHRELAGVLCNREFISPIFPAYVFRLLSGEVTVTHRHNYINHVGFQYAEIYRKESRKKRRKRERETGRQKVTKKQQIAFEQRRSPSKSFIKLI